MDIASINYQHTNSLRQSNQIHHHISNIIKNEENTNVSEDEMDYVDNEEYIVEREKPDLGHFHRGNNLNIAEDLSISTPTN